MSLLFAVHPLRVESVAWIAERKELLSSCFYLLSLLLYVAADRLKSRRYRYGSILALVCSLLSKPMAVTLPFVLLLIDYVQHKRIDTKSLFNKIPWFVIAGACAILAVVTQHQSGAIAGNPYLSIMQRICLPFYGLLFYMVKTVVPLHLSALYPIPEHPGGLFLAQLYLAPAMIAGVALIVYRARRSRAIVFGALFYLITLLPVAQIVLIGDFLVADRYAYLPTIGLYCIAAAGIVFLLEEKLRSNRAAKALFFIGMGSAAVLLSFGTYMRCGVWKSSLTLWNDCLARHPCAIAFNNRGSALAAMADYHRAIDDFNRALTLSPGFADGYYNRGLAFSAMGDNDRAIDNYSRAITLNPRMTKAYNDRGVALAAMHNFDAALKDYNQAMLLDSGIAAPHYNCGLLYAARGDYDGALEEYTRAIERDPSLVEPHNNRALAYCYKGEFGRAIDDFGSVLAADPGRASAWFNRGHAFAAMGDGRRAAADFRRACDLGLEQGCRALQGY